jgi:type IV pilus assembly protein PilB
MNGVQVASPELQKLVVEKLGLLDGTEFESASRSARRLGIPLEQAVAERGQLPVPFLLKQLAESWGVHFTELRIADVERGALRLVSEDYARCHGLVPFRADRTRVHVAMSNPRDRAAIDGIERSTGRSVVPHLATESTIHRAQLLYKGDLVELMRRGVGGACPSASPGAQPAFLPTTAIELVDRLLEYAVLTGASDIHIEPFRSEAIVRCRIDGMLHDVLSLSPASYPALVARIKVLANLRLDERRAPQDGRFEAEPGGSAVDLRVSSVPTLWGEKLVLRVLPKEATALDLDSLGLSTADHSVLLRNLMRPHGMILVTGPTGSGKTTTLYGMVIQLGAERQNLVNISTIEDPIEYTIPRVVQIPINPDAGVEFSSGLRALLRQDPDVIMVGEIRDRETADIAIRSALIGRLLLSTLHTNDATSTPARLLDMGVEPYLIASTLSVVIGQRLVRRICTSCRESVPAEEALLESLRRRADFEQTVAVLRRDGVLPAGADPFANLRLFHGRGCDYCNGTGFQGRTGIFEFFEIDDRIRAAIMVRSDAASLRNDAVARGMKTLFQDGLAKALVGETTLGEVLRVAL